MAKTVTLTVLIDMVRKYGDLENDTAFASDTEITLRLNRSIASLYEQMVNTNEEYFVSSADTTTTSGTTDYAVHSSFYRLLGVDLSISSTEFVSLPRFNFAERNTRRSSGTNDDCVYSLWGGYVRVIPAPPAGRTLRIWYVPAYTTLSSGSDTFDAVNGWEEWVVLDTVIGIWQKEESDTQDLERRQAMAWDRIMAAIGKRDSANPSTVLDIDRISDLDDFYPRRTS